MPKNHNDAMMMDDDEDLELDDGVMQELLHDDDDPSASRSNSSSSDDEESNHDDTPHYRYNYKPSKQQLLHQKSPTSKQSKDVENIHKAASQLSHVINKYGGNTSSKWEDILTAVDSPWKDNVDAALDEIVAARDGMVQAWDEFHANNDNVDSDKLQTMDNENNNDGHQQQQQKMGWWESILPPSKKRLGNRQEHDANDETWNQTNTDNNNIDEQQQFHQVYMEYATNAFAIELEALRRGTLEQQTSAFNKKKKKGTNNDKSSTQGMELDLDPTHHSFVVASKRSGNNDNDDEAAAAEVDVQVLSDMLSSGSQTLSGIEKHMLLKARQRGSSAEEAAAVFDTKSNDGLSLHERRRQELGLLSGR